MKSTLFLDVMPCSLVFADVSEERIASIFKVEEPAEQPIEEQAGSIVWLALRL
jgi:hypothetical protein